MGGNHKTKRLNVQHNGIRVRMTPEKLESVRKMAKKRGFPTVSDYVRELIERDRRKWFRAGVRGLSC